MCAQASLKTIKQLFRPVDLGMYTYLSAVTGHAAHRSHTGTLVPYSKRLLVQDTLVEAVPQTSFTGLCSKHVQTGSTSTQPRHITPFTSVLCSALKTRYSMAKSAM
jgi:hypothetical protein